MRHGLCGEVSFCRRSGRRLATMGWAGGREEQMLDGSNRTVLCLASFEKGQEFIGECRRQGCHVILLTLPTLEDKPWPRECIDEVFLMPDLYDREAVINGVSYLCRTRQIDRIAPLDDFDVQMGATLREHL